MVFPKPNLSSNSQNTIRDISNHTSNADQAKGVLRRYILTSLIKLRVREQLWFMKTCITEDLATPRIWKMVERLKLHENQAVTLRRTMMKNLRKELYQKIAQLTRELSQKKEDVEALLTEEDYATFKQCEQHETNYAKPKLRKHFHDRRMWIRKKTGVNRTKDLPKEIDGIVMEDQVIEERFNARVRQYGGVTLDEDEVEALKMQPNFAIFEEVNELNFMANTEKTFNSLRWNKNLHENNEEQEERSPTEPKPFFNDETKTFDASNIQNCDVPFRKRVGIPECAEVTTEARLTLCKESLNKVLKEYKVNQESAGNNLTKQQNKGLGKLKRRIKNKEIVCFQTDKSGSMSVDTPGNYIESMQPHLEGTIPSTEEEYTRTEKLLNAHMQTWCRIMKFDKRVARNYVTENNEIPPLYGLRKDHKDVPTGEEEKGPPQRPVCGAVVASNYRMSHFISSILQPVIQQAKHPCSSTEDMLSRVKLVNETVDLTNCVIGSMDVKFVVSVN